MSDKQYIINKTKSILIVQDNENKKICILQPFSASYEPYDVELLKRCRHIQQLKALDYISLSSTGDFEFNEFGKDYGQKWAIGALAQLKGEGNIQIQILAYSPNTGKYKIKIVKSGGTLIVTEKEIVPVITEEDINETVEVIDNEGVQEDDEGALNAEDAEKFYLKEAQQQNQEAEVTFYENEVHEEEGDFEEQFIVKPEGSKFADEVSFNRVAQDTSKEVTKKLVSALKKVEPSKTENQLDLENIPSQYQKWFMDFSQKDDRKKKIAISACTDVKKLELIIQFGGEKAAKLASAKLSKLQNK